MQEIVRNIKINYEKDELSENSRNNKENNENTQI